MAAFDLQRFVASANLDVFERCQKDDLLELAAHYGVFVSRSLDKWEILSKVLAKLIELGVLELSSPVVTSMVHGAENDDAVFATSATEPIGPMTEARATLPHFDPFSPYLSPGSKPVRNCALHTSKWRPETKQRHVQLEMEFRTSARKMELEVDREVTYGSWTWKR